VFATFNFKSADIASADKHYIDEHVPLTLKLPDLRQYITGRIRSNAEYRPPHRAAVNYFDTEADLKWALHKSPAAKPLLVDGAANLRVNRWLELDSEIIVPFEPRWPGLDCFVLALEFELKLKGREVQPAEKHYLEYSVEMAKRLPHLRHYMISKYQMSRRLDTFEASGAAPIRQQLRMAMLVFESFEAMSDSLTSPAGQELKRDQEYTMTKTRIYHIDATVQR
jgi:uncharacterized protein (TIGR02118 family)